MKKINWDMTWTFVILFAVAFNIYKYHEMKKITNYQLNETRKALVIIDSMTTKATRVENKFDGLIKNKDIEKIIIVSKNDSTAFIIKSHLIQNDQ